MAETMRDKLNNQLKKKSLQNPMKSYMWFMQLPDASKTKMAEDVMLDISSRITNVTVPFTQFETEKETRGNSFRYFAKSADIGNITFEIVEFDDGLTRKYLQNWQNLMVATLPREGGPKSVPAFTPPSHYKRNIKMYRFDDLKGEVYYDLYKGYFISGIEDLSSDYESSELLKYSVTLTGDDISYHDSITGEIDAGRDSDGNPWDKIADRVQDGEEFLRKVQTARTSARSIVDILG